MTEADMIARAKMYMELLAGGINPLTGDYLDEDECASQERMQKCFAFTAEVLEKAWKNAVQAEIKANRRQMSDFCIQPDALAAFPYSDEPVGLNSLRTMFNSLIDESKVKKLKTTAITAFLVSSGMLEKRGSSSYPTAAGKDMGISVVMRQDGFSGRSYEQVLYSKAVQRFLVDNIDSLCVYNRERAIRVAANGSEPAL